MTGFLTDEALKISGLSQPSVAILEKLSKRYRFATKNETFKII